MGCAVGGADCVLQVQVRNSSGGLASWSMLPFAPPRELRLPPANVTATVGAATAAGTVPITLRTNATALFVVLTSHAAGRFSDNSLLLEAGAATVDFISWEAGGVDSTQLALLRSTLRVEHLAENL